MNWQNWACHNRSISNSHCYPQVHDTCWNSYSCIQHDTKDHNCHIGQHNCSNWLHLGRFCMGNLDQGLFQYPLLELYIIKTGTQWQVRKWPVCCCYVEIVYCSEWSQSCHNKLYRPSAWKMCLNLNSNVPRDLRMIKSMKALMQGYANTCNGIKWPILALTALVHLFLKSFSCYFPIDFIIIIITCKVYRIYSITQIVQIFTTL